MNDQDVLHYISLLDRTFKVKCQEDEVPALYEAQTLLQKHLERVQNGNENVAFESVLSIAALNLARELIETKGNTAQDEIAQKSMRAMQEKIEKSLEKYD